ncbi:MAG: serine/threonine-protein kinase [Pseudonocardiaceae bacterium]
MSEPTGPPATSPDNPDDRGDPEQAAGPAATRPDGAGDGAGEGSGEGRFIPDRLPPRLSHYRIVEQLGSGGQARLYRCEDGERRQVVVKIFNRVRERLPEVWARWQEASEQYVVPLLEAFTEGQQGYEVTPYLPLGSLDDRARNPRRALAAAELELVLDQLAEALNHIHTQLCGDKLIHRDIKPPNILVLSDDPLQVRLTDFGIAVAQSDTYEARSTTSRTAAYTAPEGLADSTPPQDWWSLGMTLLELHQGCHPFELPDGRWLPEDRVIASLARGIPIPESVDARWQTLLRGLLAPDYQLRWGYHEVRRWLAGEEMDPPRLPPHSPPPPHRETPFAFAGAVVHRPEELAAAIATHWAEAAALVVGRRWQDLRDWAGAVSPALEEAIATIERVFVTPARPVDRTVSELLVTLDPNATPVFRGRAADEAGLSALAAAATANPPEGTAIDVIDALYDSGGLRALAGLHGHDGLALIDERWHRWCELADTAVEQTRSAIDGLEEFPAAALLRSLLLAAAVDSGTAARLAQRAGSLATRKNQRVVWFRRLADAADGDDAPAYHTVMALSAGLLHDSRYCVSAPSRVRVRGMTRQAAAERVQRSGEAARRAARRVWRASPLAGAGLVYLALVVVVGLGVGSGTSALEGVLTGVVLLVAGGCLYVGMAYPGHRFADALLTGLAGAWIGVFLAAALGVVVGLTVGPAAGWPVFWTAWLTTIVAGTALGAVR